jgi:putative nucleotidyltransferase with HDIG domain
MSTRSATVIHGRPRAGLLSGVILSVLFAATLAPLATVESWLSELGEITPGAPAPYTVRVPLFLGLRDSAGQITAERGSIVVARGAIVDAEAAAAAAAIRRQSPDRVNQWIAYGTGFLILGLLYTTYLRRSHRGRLLRAQAVSLALLCGVSALVKAALLYSSLSILAVPVAGASIIAALAIDLYAGFATALIASFTVGLLAPFDPGVVAVLAVQGIAPVLALGDDRRHSRKETHIVGAGLVGGLAAGLTYVVLYYLSWRQSPLSELDRPLESAWLAAAAGGALSGLVALVCHPLYQWLLGEITKHRLVELSDLSNPLLKQIADKAPGTWQHSLAMANMAEVAAHTIGANARLVRCGALYHDLGKSLQPKYYIENLGPGDASPHDNLPPEVSCDAIFSHVTEGVRLARKERLPERVIDFMHMHHGDGFLEYFWAKCREQGNPKSLTAEEFRYPGVRPQSRETAILAICDAVEAASRTLKQPDARSIENLVQRIVYGKLHLGQLDESGLSMADLRLITSSLMDTIKHAYHVRVEYPWQREERAESESGSQRVTAPETPRAQEAAAERVRAKAARPPTHRIHEPPLDSLDVPRPYWRTFEDDSMRNLAMAQTERVSSQPPPVDDPALTPPRPASRPDTEPEPELEAELSPAVPYPALPGTPADAAHAPASSQDGDETTSPGHPDLRPPRPAAASTAREIPRTVAITVGTDTVSLRPVAEADPLPSVRPPPPPKSTVQLMKVGADGRAERTAGQASGDSPLAPRPSVHTETHRSASEDGALAPGVLVVGAPPATQPKKTAPRPAPSRPVGTGDANAESSAERGAARRPYATTPRPCRYDPKRRRRAATTTR